ncbi:hypothetical protein BpHYR1_004751 [Brachionus plicatilis]|uniref:Uncharacterized protein n=1 Tax=Brachionus plicatilis TaxID=10195 RepID=A0A3M7PNQ3_BRAPC|nr:hypothetical protein BpHYR1_004751 [Brachionus plicatilis]
MNLHYNAQDFLGFTDDLFGPWREHFKLFVSNLFELSQKKNLSSKSFFHRFTISSTIFVLTLMTKKAISSLPYYSLWKEETIHTIILKEYKQKIKLEHHNKIWIASTQQEVQILTKKLKINGIATELN